VSYQILIKDLPVQERPRERLLQYGPEYLSNRELLAILLETGTRNQSVFALADQLIAHFGSLRALACATYEEMAEIKGIGPAKAARVIAAFELTKRLSNSSLEVREVIRSPQDAADIVMDEMSLLDREHFVILMLNTKHAVIAKKVVSIGHLNASLVHPRELFKDVIKKSSAAVILVHNHPSGDPTPSEDDIRVTQRLCEAGRLLGISVLDHIVIGDKSYVSFREQGLI
jgi:DNA repair protein RadC